MTDDKPTAKVIGKDGNVFNIMGICINALKQAGKEAKSREMTNRIQLEARDYAEALCIMAEYVDME